MGQAGPRDAGCGVGVIALKHWVDDRKWSSRPVLVVAWCGRLVRLWFEKMLERRFK